MIANAYAATHDDLTHLPNEYLLMDRLKQAVALSERSTNLFALLMVMPDKLSQIQQRQGQAFCDQLIIMMAARLDQQRGRRDYFLTNSSPFNGLPLRVCPDLTPYFSSSIYLNRSSPTG